MQRPSVHEKASFGLDDCPGVPTFQAGYLVGGNGGWRNRRPVVTLENCRGCLQCYLYCPDGAIAKVEPDVVELDAAIAQASRGERPAKLPAVAHTTVSIDYDFCKGCGICVKLCHFDALHMEDEPR